MKAGLASCSPDPDPCIKELVYLSIICVEVVHGVQGHCSHHLVYLGGGGQTDRQGIAGPPSLFTLVSLKKFYQASKLDRITTRRGRPR